MIRNRQRTQGLDARQTQPHRELLVDPFWRAVMGRVRTVDGDPGGDQLQQHLAFGTVCRQPLDRPKQNGMMRDDESGTALDRLAGHVRGQRQARQNSLRFASPVSHQQTDIVPIFRQIEGGETFEKGDEVGDTRHGGDES